ncbi:hypothetical protein OCK02_04865 (plasmid) [Rhizobium sp. TRM96647]|uniref:hypothetical protein n=1 Tax=unclassified Rhizobium TaxID=2613769 RepID=UPI0021E719BF|nr:MULTISPECIES: hypothetical protein [unclassified Rhizobium]MCV3735529.1 hypothetical protein [Rhizobium sp. TRM96647]MCV3757708.1 hypothetical protein [Rhizobium sp. TRM96650]
MARQIRHVLEDMLEAIEGISTASQGKSFSDYQSDWLLRHGLERGTKSYPKRAARCLRQ